MRPRSPPLSLRPTMFKCKPTPGTAPPNNESVHRPLFSAWVMLFACVLQSSFAAAQVSQNLLSEAPPQYEIGAGLIALNVPDYSGSKNTRIRVVPFPYYIYRGEYLRADDEGTRARLISSKRHEVGLSFGFNFPVNSEGNSARAGMPNLDGIVAIGPRLLFRFLTDKPNQKLNLSFATRAVFSSKFSFNNLFRAEGYSLEPTLNYWYQWQRSQLTLFSTLSFEFGSARYNQFFYNVSPQFQTATRPQFHARSGLVERSMSIGLGHRINNRLFIFGGTSWRNLAWAANRHSPLVETEDNFTFITGLVWTFFESRQKVKQL